MHNITENFRMFPSLQKQNIVKKKKIIIKKKAQLVQKLICTKPMFYN